jgi:folate-binding protein YgfZ
MFSPAHYDALRSRAGFLDRSTRVRLRLTGGDRLAYLHGLLTNDVASLAAGTGSYAALLTPQGRMISDMRILELGDATSIDLPPTAGADVRDKLEQFVFSEDVAIADVSETVEQIGVYGPAAPEAVARMLSDASDAPSADRLERMTINSNARASVNGAEIVVARSDDYGAPGFDVFADRSFRLRDRLITAAVPEVDADAARVTRIEAGRPEFGADMTDDTIPLEAGIEDRAISLTKGCYVGQEIIIRVLHRGHGRVARRLVGLRAADGGSFGPGDRVKAGDRDIGFVTSAADSPLAGTRIGLGYVHRDFVEPGTTVDIGGAPGVVAELPFTAKAAR